MLEASLRRDLGSPMQKQGDESCLKENQEEYAACMFLWPVK